jgi:hypothetical protein
LIERILSKYRITSSRIVTISSNQSIIGASMKESLYAAFLRLPRFKGHGRLTPIIRDALFRRRPRRIVHGLYILLDPIEGGQAGSTSRQQRSRSHRFGDLLRLGVTYIDVGDIGFITPLSPPSRGSVGVIAIDPQPYNCARILESGPATVYAFMLALGRISVYISPSAGQAERPVIAPAR